MDMILTVNEAVAIAIEKLPDVLGKIFIVPKDLFDEYGEVEKTVYEEWIFTANKVGEVNFDEYTKYKSEE